MRRVLRTLQLPALKTHDIATSAALSSAADTEASAGAAHARSRQVAPPRNEALRLTPRGSDATADSGASSSRNAASVARLRGLVEVGTLASVSADALVRAEYQHVSTADLAAVGQLADRLSELEARLEAGAPPAPASRDDLERQVRRLQADHDRASEQFDEIAQQVARARDIVETRERGLTRKVGQLEQLQQQLAAFTASSSSAVGSSASASPDADAAAAWRDRLDALAARQANIKRSRAAVARHASEVAERDERRRLIESTRGLNAEEVRNAVADWFRASCTPRAGRGRGDARTNRPFADALDEAFRGIADFGKKAGGPTARQVIGAFMNAIERCEAKVMRPTLEKHLVMVVADHAVITQSANAGLWTRILRWAMNTTGIRSAHLAVDSLEEAMRFFIKKLEMPRPSGRAAMLTDGQILKGRSLERATAQTRQMLDGLVANREALLEVLTGIDQAFSQHFDDGPEEALGREAASQLGAYYSRELQSVSGELAAMSRPLSRAVQVQPAMTSQTQSIGDLEVRISRLEGKIDRQTERHRADFEKFEAVSARHLEAGDEIAAIEHELKRDRALLDDMRAQRRERLQAQRARQAEAGEIARELDAAWNAAAAAPAVHQIISPEALMRVNRMHLDQSPEQMGARLATVPRTGTFSSRASLLRVLVDIAGQELSKPRGQSALLATSEQVLAQLPGAREDGRIDALCSHGRTIGSGVRRSAAAQRPSRTGTSQYTIGWVSGQGPRITHLHPWISPY